MSCYPSVNKIADEELTWGSETSQYPEERKSNETPKVAASEMGIAQTFRFRPGGVVGPPDAIHDRAGEAGWKAAP